MNSLNSFTLGSSNTSKCKNAPKVEVNKHICNAKCVFAPLYRSIYFEN